MTNLDFAKRVQAMVEQRLKELERSLSIARAAGINVERLVNEGYRYETMEGNTRSRPRFNVRLSVDPSNISMDVLPDMVEGPFKIVWREDNGTGGMFATGDIYEDDDAITQLRGKRNPVIVDALPSVFEVEANKGVDEYLYDE